MVVSFVLMLASSNGKPSPRASGPTPAPGAFTVWYIYRPAVSRVAAALVARAPSIFARTTLSGGFTPAIAACTAACAAACITSRCNVASTSAGEAPNSPLSPLSDTLPSRSPSDAPDTRLEGPPPTVLRPMAPL